MLLAIMHHSLALWRDPRGQVSPLRVASLAVLLLVPASCLAYDWWTYGVPPRTVNDVIHRTGYWALMFVLVSLAITPLRRVARWNALLDVRRMIGVGAFCYAAVHLSLYVVDQAFDLPKVASEIALRLYLTIGFTALLGLGVLAATSTDGMVRRLGTKRWLRLHQIVYVVALLALVHFFQQTKLDVTVPTFVAALFGWLMCYRAITWWWIRRGEPSTTILLTLTLVAAALTFAVEALAIGYAFHVSPLRVLETAFDFDLTIRPGWIVLAAGLAVVILDLVRTRVFTPRAKTSRRSSAEVRPVLKRV